MIRTRWPMMTCGLWLEDPSGRLWIGTADGLDLLDRASGRFSHHRHDTADPESLRDSFIMSLYTDAAGLMWIGTRAGGVSRWNLAVGSSAAIGPSAAEQAGHRICRRSRQKGLGWNSGRRSTPVRSGYRRGAVGGHRDGARQLRR